MSHDKHKPHEKPEPVEPQGFGDEEPTTGGEGGESGPTSPPPPPPGR